MTLKSDAPIMHDRLFHAVDTLMGAIATITVSSVAAVTTTRSYDPDDQLFQTLLPLVGVVLVAAGAVLLNPQVEKRNIVMGRAFIASFFGLISPSITIAIAPNVLPDIMFWVVDVMKFPVALIGMGGVATGISYILSRPFFARAYERADAIAIEQLRRIEELAKGPNNTVVVLDPTKVGVSTSKLLP